MCPRSEAVRADAATPAQIRQAREAGEQSPLWSAGWVPRPLHLVPAPAHLSMRTWTPDGDEKVLDKIEKLAGAMSQWIFSDGSCTTHVDPLRRRAGWACVEVAPYLINRQLVKLRAVWGTLPEGWPQTLQAAEFAAAVAAAELAGAGAELFSDCLGVVRCMAGNAQSQLQPQRRWAGAYLLAHAFSTAKKMLAKTHKVPAHTEEHEGEDLPTRLRRLANSWADELAKQAVLLHDPMDDALAIHMRRVWRDAQTACVVLAKSTRLWPAAAELRPREDRPTTRLAREHRVRGRDDRLAAERDRKARLQSQAEKSHVWAQCGGRQRCRLCLAFRAQGVPLCSGVATDWIACIQDAQALGHHMERFALHDSGGVDVIPMVACSACGAWSSCSAVATKSLFRQPCKHRPSRAGDEVLKRLARGLHPKPGRDPPLASSLGLAGS